MAAEQLNVAGVTEELNFKFCVVLVSLIRYMGLLAPVLETQGPLGGAAECYLIILPISTKTPLQQQHDCWRSQKKFTENRLKNPKYLYEHTRIL